MFAGQRFLYCIMEDVVGCSSSFLIQVVILQIPFWLPHNNFLINLQTLLVNELDLQDECPYDCLPGFGIGMFRECNQLGDITPYGFAEK